MERLVDAAAPGQLVAVAVEQQPGRRTGHSVVADDPELVVEQDQRFVQSGGRQEVIGLVGAAGDTQPDRQQLSVVLLSELLNVGPFSPTDASTR